MLRRSSIFSFVMLSLLLSASAWSQTPVGELFATDPGVPAVEQPAGSGMQVTTGSELTAGIAPATLKLYKGGRLVICPKTKITVNSDHHGLMFGMDAGAVEVDIKVEKDSTNTVFTPDLSVRLSSSGTYHFALGVNSQGDTCFRPLKGNAAGVVVAELMGSDEEGIAGDQAALFHGGKLAGRSPISGECGCPPPAPVVTSQTGTPSTQPSGSAPVAASSPTPAPVAIAAASPPAEEASQPAHTAVEAPFVFSAVPAPARVQFSSLPNVFLAQEDVDPSVPGEREKSAASSSQEKDKGKSATTASTASSDGAAKPEKAEKKGFFGRIKGLFTGLFHR
jgi:hypothetical protein